MFSYLFIIITINISIRVDFNVLLYYFVSVSQSTEYGARTPEDGLSVKNKGLISRELILFILLINDNRLIEQFMADFINICTLRHTHNVYLNLQGIIFYIICSPQTYRRKSGVFSVNHSLFFHGLL